MKDEEKRFEGTAEKQNFEKKQNKIVKIWETLKDIWERCKSIPNIFHRISLTIKGICDKIDWWKACSASQNKSRDHICKRKSVQAAETCIPREDQRTYRFWKRGSFCDRNSACSIRDDYTAASEQD